MVMTMVREQIYGLAAESARAVAPLAGALAPSLSAGIAERRAAAAVLSEWARRTRDPSLPLLWVHGASAGELDAVQPILPLVRGEEPCQVVVTYFSPSGAPAAAALNPDYCGFPPFDAPRPCRAVVKVLRPTALVFAKWDVWPQLTSAVSGAGAAVGMINATVAPRSSRLRYPARWFLRPAYDRLRRVGAVSRVDADHLYRIGVRREAVRVTGDAAFDRALARASRPLPEASGILTWLQRRARVQDAPEGEARAPSLCIVAGSTWPDDEKVLLDAVAAVERSGCSVRLVWVPHRPEPRTVEALARRCSERLGRPALLWSRLLGHGPEDGENGAYAPLIVDTVGLLADLYGVGDVAYVGGGFGSSGLHSVVEPAAAGVPILFGPCGDRREAEELLARGAARRVSAKSCSEELLRLARDEPARKAMGREARRYVEGGVGAAAASAALVLKLLDGG